MAYGIGSILGDIDQKADTYRNNPDALAQSYQQNQQLIDLLVLQKLKTDKEAAQRDMQAKMQTPASTIKDQREQQVMGMTRNEVAQQVTPGLQALAQQQQAAQTQGISSLPAPNMQQIGMAEGGIVNFAEAGLVNNAGMDPATMGPENEDLIYGASLARREPSADISALVPSKAMERTPSTPQSAYTQQLADLRTEQESKLESLIAFLKGAGGQSSFAATVMGGSDAMNAREAGVKAEIMDVLGKLETIDLKERELGFEQQRIGQTAEQLRLQGLRDTAAAENDAEQSRIAGLTQKAAQANYESEDYARRHPTPATLTDQQERVKAHLAAARVRGDDRDDSVIIDEYNEHTGARAERIAQGRVDTTTAGQAQDIKEQALRILATEKLNTPVLGLPLPAAEQAARDEIRFNEIMKLLAPSAPPVNPVDPNDPAAGFYN